MFSGCGRSAQEQAQTQAQNTTPNLPSSLPPRFRFQNYFGKRNTNETGFVFILMSNSSPQQKLFTKFVFVHIIMLTFSLEFAVEYILHSAALCGKWQIMKEWKNINNISENKSRKTFYTQIIFGGYSSRENKAENAGKMGWQLMKIHAVFFS